MGNGAADAPEHTVSLSDYWIQRTEVTNRQYALCVTLGQCDPPQDAQSAKDLTDESAWDHPVTGVTWEQSAAYCRWITGDLPTEAQREKAARGPDRSTYPWGETEPGLNLLNYNNQLGTTSGVHAYPAGQSVYHGFDMAGNVYEWGRDWYGQDYYPVSPPADPTGPDSGEQRVVRGGGFSSGADQIPSAARFHSPPTQFRQDLGFRCVVERPAPKASYCQVGGYVPGGTTPGGATPDGGSCSPTVDAGHVGCTGGGSGLGTLDIGGGPITSIEILSPADGSAICTDYRGMRVGCISRDPGAAIQVRVCVSCGGGATGEPAPALEVVCPAGSSPDSANPERCIRGIALAEEVALCGPGLIPDPASPGGCMPDPCPPGYSGSAGACREDTVCEGGTIPDPSNPGGCMPNPCPPGSVYSGGRCVDPGTPRLLCDEGSYWDWDTGACVPDTLLDVSTLPCIAGTYRDAITGFCVSGPGPVVPGGECLAGFALDPGNSCCQPADGTSYPGCTPSEGLILREIGSDSPPALSCERLSGGASCTTVTVRTGVCPEAPGPGVPTDCGGLDKNACHNTKGCSWDDQGSICS
jgi:hypothetical protein